QTGDYYYNIARGIDDRPVRAHRTRKSVGNETTFENNLRDKKQIWSTLKRLANNVSEVMNKKNLVARTLTLKVRYSDFQLITRSKTCEQPIQTQDEILEVLPELLKKTEVGKRPIRLIGVTFANLQTIEGESDDNTTIDQVNEGQQLGLF
ncbi:MAG: hypothetical protein ACKE8R_07885, partial [Methylophagaceae bacterium]